MQYLKYFFYVIFILFVGLTSSYYFDNKTNGNNREINLTSTKKINIRSIASKDSIKLYSGALNQIGIVTSYDFSNGYYSKGGYPPADKGVCTDVIWRAFSNMQIDFKKLLDADMKKSPKAYNSNFDSNINFRRVRNLNVFFSRKGKGLTKELIPNNISNLTEWQTGDIVTFEQSKDSKLWHIGTISNKRRSDGVPYMIDNHGYGVKIRITPLERPTKIMGHYRYFN